MRPNPRTDEYALAAVTTAAEQLARDRGWDHTDPEFVKSNETVDG